jgi:hypothetical protein
MTNEELLNRAGRVADLAISLVGGESLNYHVPPVHPDHFSATARQLRLAAEAYNSGVIELAKQRSEEATNGN